MIFVLDFMGLESKKCEGNKGSKMKNNSPHSVLQANYFFQTLVIIFVLFKIYHCYVQTSILRHCNSK